MTSIKPKIANTTIFLLF